MSEAANVDVVRRVLDAINRDDMVAVATMIAPGFVRHDLSGLMADYAGPGGAADYLQRLRRAFPDMLMTIEDAFGTDNRVAARITISGTQSGEFLGAAPTGRQVAFAGVNIYRVEGDKLAETWQLIDWAGALQQINAK